ncbi:alpha/beta fold hydrolase [Nonomuraea basaltis]|uniref:alpha/beta fold hydrolase n=1 Tax=Nonomuraea basaltis TaxID=2495887 RepID=UPI00110C4050|nr:alpha/beta hydrolase [Nonomuraea basaltis]TMR93948.1 alpha/beta hydrolase [Nonomuraea basaltis]
MTRHRYGPDRPERTYVPHDFPEQTFDTGEIHLNYAVAGAGDRPALLLIPGQSESWWGYEQAMHLLQGHFQCYAVDLRGQGRSTRTPGRYTLDNFGNDLVRFIAGVIARPVIVSGLSSGAVLAAWLSAYAPPGTIRGAHYEDPPLFHSEVDTSCGQSLRQGIGPKFALWSKYLGDQWSIGDWDGMRAAAPAELPAWMLGLIPDTDEPPQNLKEYDPEWARAFWTGTVAASCDHSRMLAAVKVSVLFTHHFRMVDERTGHLMGALSDLQAARVQELVTATGNRIDYLSFPQMGHSMHGQDPQLFTKTLTEWAATLPA